MRNGGCESRSGVRKLVSCVRRSEDQTDNFSRQPGEGQGGNTGLAPELTQARQGAGGLLVAAPGATAHLLKGQLRALRCSSAVGCACPGTAHVYGQVLTERNPPTITNPAPNPARGLHLQSPAMKTQDAEHLTTSGTHIKNVLIYVGVREKKTRPGQGCWEMTQVPVSCH